MSPTESVPRPAFTLIGRASSINVRKVLWTCVEIGLPYMFDSDWGTGVRAERRSFLMTLNPNDQFPVLVDDKGPLWESNTICRYLAGIHGRIDLLPLEPRARAGVEQWMDWQATDLNSAWRYAFMALVRQDTRYDRPDELEASVKAWNAAMTILDHRLADTGAFVAGPTFTLADIVIGASVNRWMLTPMRKPQLPAVEAYFERLGAHPGFVTHVRNGTP